MLIQTEFKKGNNFLNHVASFDKTEAKNTPRVIWGNCLDFT